ncbi:two-component system sensor histidine kinase MtrB [Corynebacterium glutamicum]|uniref:two-component system sensor histidine kinase MtrB n=1 Tax=Corynebacterium glutamicum TaxID=1718 RepID=UPI0018E9D532|nr:two-component system sensor histidine kinase MtrB [Corynebacterium glutamicum]
MVDKWRTSLQVRVLGSIFTASAVVMILLGLGMLTVFTQRLVDQKIDIASSEIDRARVIVEEQITASGASTSVQARVNSARAALSSLGTSGSTETNAAYDPVVLVNNDDLVVSPEGYQIPERLRYFVSENQVSYQFSSIDQGDGSSYQALIIGTPTESDIPNLQVYLVFSMESDESSLALMRGLLSAALLIVVVLLVGIAWLATQQVTAPVRSASRIVERFAQGKLRERMVVEGEDEMARLAVSFNAMAESLSAQITKLEEYGNLQRQFTSDVSHELRTPLTTVRMAADLIADSEDELSPGARRASQLMTRELDRFESLLSDLLEISRHDAGVAELSTALHDVRIPVRSALEQVQHLATELDVELLVDLPEEAINIQGDSRRIERIIRNLLANAIDHSKGLPVELKVADNEDAVAIVVIDHGVGLKPGQDELVFNRFWRADPSRVRHSGGTGLGLAISREDAMLHGGNLDAAGTIGVGSIFRLVLPKEPHGNYREAPIPLIAPETPWEGEQQ